METVETWGEAVMLSVTEALQNFLGFLPALIGALLILILGWIISGLLAGLVERGLQAIGFERAAQSTGISGFIQRSGSSWTASAIVAEIVKWFIRLLAIQAAASILGLTQISQIVNAIMLWLPNLVVAIVIVVIGTLIAKFVSGLVRGSTSQMGFTNPDLLASVAYYAIVVFAVMAAIDQLRHRRDGGGHAVHRSRRDGRAGRRPGVRARRAADRGPDHGGLVRQGPRGGREDRRVRPDAEPGGHGVSDRDAGIRRRPECTAGASTGTDTADRAHRRLSLTGGCGGRQRCRPPIHARHGEISPLALPVRMRDAVRPHAAPERSRP